MKNTHMIIVKLKKKKSYRIVWFHFVWNDLVCMYKLCLEGRSGRRHTGSVNCGHSRNRVGRVRPVSYFHFIWFCAWFFFKDFPFSTVIIFKILHFLKAYASKCSKKWCVLINILKSRNDVHKTKELTSVWKCIFLFIFCSYWINLAFLLNIEFQDTSAETES